jgi:hypothetical protein
MPIVIETLEEFMERNGGTPIGDGEGSTWFLPSGASVCEPDIRREPPPDPVERAFAQLHYLHLRLNRQRGEYDAQQAYIAEQCHLHSTGAGPLPDDSQFDNLAALRVAVAKVEAEIAAKQIECQRLRPPVKDLEVTRAAERNARANQALTRMRKIMDAPLPNTSTQRGKVSV